MSWEAPAVLQVEANMLSQNSLKSVVTNLKSVSLKNIFFVCLKLI